MKYNYQKAVTELPELLRKEREALDLTQQEIADLLPSKKANGEALDLKTYQRYEQGKVFPPIQILCKLCELFNCEMDYLLFAQTYKVKEVGKASEVTGLSVKAIEELAGLKGTMSGQFNRIIDAFITWGAMPSLLTRIESEVMESAYLKPYIKTKRFKQIYSLYLQHKLLPSESSYEDLLDAICDAVGTPKDNMRYYFQDGDFYAGYIGYSAETLVEKYNESDKLEQQFLLDDSLTDAEREQIKEKAVLVNSQIEVFKYMEALENAYNKESRRYEITRLFRLFVDKYVRDTEEVRTQDLQGVRKNAKK